jgi:hypothetical protein
MKNFARNTIQLIILQLIIIGIIMPFTIPGFTVTMITWQTALLFLVLTLVLGAFASWLDARGWW